MDTNMAENERKSDTEKENDDIEEICVTENEGDESTEKIDDSSHQAIAGQLMQNPQVLAALQGRLEQMTGLRSGYIESLPKPVKRRLKALKKLQFEMIKIESEFYKEVHELECKYAAKYAPIFDKRREIISSGIEPSDSDCDWPSDEEEVSLSNELEHKAKLQEIDETKNDENPEAVTVHAENVTGVPEFWLTIFKNVEMLADMVQEHDEPVLKLLQDIKVSFQTCNPMGFTLQFHFEKNEFFTNTVLTKEYIMRAEPDKEDPFAFEGPEIISCKGCSIDWNKGKNLTIKIVKKTQKHKGRGTKRTVTKTVQNDSFFNFFSPPEVPEEGEPDEDTEALLAADFEIGHYMRERIVPRAVLYFTGEALEEDDEDFEEGEEIEEEEEDEDEDHDPDYVPGPDDKPADCKQQ